MSNAPGSSSPETKAATPNKRTLESNAGISLCSGDDCASRDAILLFHGMTGTPGEMTELAQEFHSRGFDCFAPRLSGHGSTILELANTPLRAWLEDSEISYSELQRYRRLYIIGQSFGALLGLHLALQYPSRVERAVLLSLPWQFRSAFQTRLLRMLTYLPEPCFRYLGYQKKRKRDGVVFRQKRHAYDSHSIAAAVRVAVLQKMLKKKLKTLSVPLLLLQDPLDHHLAPESVWSFRRDSGRGALVRSQWMYGGYHELSLGPCFSAVVEDIENFFAEDSNNAA